MIAWDVRVVEETGSTNADVQALADRGTEEGLVLVARHQTAGRGRLDRRWTAAPGTALTGSLLLRPGEQVARRSWTWLPLLAGCAVVDAVVGLTGLEARLKWPNDVLLDDRKLCGILTEAVGDAAVVGIGLNVSAPPDQLPVETATSLRAASRTQPAPALDNDLVLAALLDAFGRWYERWRAAGGDPGRSGLRDSYRAWCVTLGRRVRIEVPGTGAVEGTARDIDELGRLVVETGSGPRAFGAGDVVHVR